MIIDIDNEAKRLGRTETTSAYHPFVVTAWRNTTTRTPTMVRRKTLHEALVFAEEITGMSILRWVNNGTPGNLQAFTGTHAERYRDTAQYKPARLMEYEDAVQVSTV